MWKETKIRLKTDSSIVTKEVRRLEKVSFKCWEEKTSNYGSVQM